MSIDCRQPISSVHLLLTDECNFRCVYCFHTKKPQSMSSKTATRALDWCLSMADKHMRFEFFGGEPLLNWDIMLLILDYGQLRAKELQQDISFGCVTNASLLTPKRARILSDYKVPLLLSYDGPYTNEATRGHTRDVETGMRNALEAGLRCTVAMQSCAGHTASLYENFVAIERMGFDAIAINPVTHCHDSFTKQDWDNVREALGRLADHQFERYVIGKGATYAQLDRHVLAIKNFVREPYDLTKRDRSCGACKGSMAIDPQGNILPCHEMQPDSSFDHYIMGNVNDGTYDSAARERVLVSRYSDACSSCSVLACGPCRVANYWANGNEWVPNNDACAYQRCIFDTAITLYNRLVDVGIWNGAKHFARR